MSVENIYHSEFLKTYYKKIFPSTLFCKWLSYGNIENLSNREFSFTLEDDVYIRYQSFINEKEFHEELIMRNPQKIDIGANYNIPPNKNKKLGNKQLIPKWKELVFDIDITDYDDVRFCCSKADICNKCWTLMKVAMKILDYELRESFGYSQILYVYSGRRGIHCWVCDKEARDLEFNARDAYVNYLSVVDGSSSSSVKKVELKEETQWKDKMHPLIGSSLKIINQYFIKYFIEDQKVLSIDSGEKRLLDMIPKESSEIRDTLKSIWEDLDIDKHKSISESKWKALVKNFEDDNKSKIIDEIKLEFMYPRFDMNVTSGFNHLLKSPFSVHPGTRRICVPIDINNVDDFDPLTVPTVDNVVNEMRETENIMKTSLGKYIQIFQDFVSCVS